MVRRLSRHHSDVRSGKKYTILLTLCERGETPKQRLVVIPDDPPTPAADRSHSGDQRSTATGRHV